jgi:O-antigen ligase
MSQWQRNGGISSLVFGLFVTAGVYKATPVFERLPDLTVVFAALTLVACIHAAPGHGSRLRFASFAPLCIFFGLMLLGIPLSDPSDGTHQWTQFFTLTLLAAAAPFFLIRRNDLWINYLFWFVTVLGLYFSLLVLGDPSSVSVTGRYVVLSTNTIETGRVIGAGLIWLFVLTFRRRVPLLVALAFGAPMTYAAVGAGSRGPLLATVISVILALQFGRRGSLAARDSLARRERPAIRASLAKGMGLFLGLAVLLYFGFMNAPVSSRDRLFEVGGSGGARLLAWSVSLNGIFSHPLGVGWGNWQKFADKAAPGQLIGLDHPHNLVLLALIEGGWLAGAGMVWFLARCLRSALRNAATATGQSVFALFIYFLLNSLLSDNLNDARITLAMCGTILAREALGHENPAYGNEISTAPRSTKPLPYGPHFEPT